MCKKQDIGYPTDVIVDQDDDSTVLRRDEGEMPRPEEVNQVSPPSTAGPDLEWQRLDRRRSALGFAIQFHDGNSAGSSDVVETARKFDEFLEG